MISHIGAKGAFTKILRFFTKNGCHQVIPKGGTLWKIVQTRIEEEGGRLPPPPPLATLLPFLMGFPSIFFQFLI